MRKKFILIFSGFWMAVCGNAAAQGLGVSEASAQTFSAQQDAVHLAVIKAVANYKIDDEETVKDVNNLRQNQRFNLQLQKMLNKLSNSRTKDSKNRQVLKILDRAGKDIYDILK